MVLPLAGNRSQARKLRIAGVLTGPKTLLALLKNFLLGPRSFSTGYAVDVRSAIHVLERAHPMAAAWWKGNAPHLLRPLRYFVFPAECCELVDKPGLMSRRLPLPRHRKGVKRGTP